MWSKSVRLPPKKDLILIFMVCGFPIHFWAIFIFLHEFPAYLMHLGPVEIAGILAYVLVFALLESLLATGILVMMAVILPARWFREHFLAQGTILVIVTTVWLVPLHFWSYSLLSNAQGLTSSDQPGFSAMSLPMLAWLTTFLTAVIGLSIYMRRSASFDNKLVDLADRFTVPSTVLFTLDLVCIAFIFVRNLL